MTDTGTTEMSNSVIIGLWVEEPLLDAADAEVRRRRALGELVHRADVVREALVSFFNRKSVAGCPKKQQTRLIGPSGPES
jgi:hypothetical protein